MVLTLSPLQDRLMEYEQLIGDMGTKVFALSALQRNRSPSKIVDTPCLVNSCCP